MFLRSSYGNGYYLTLVKDDWYGEGDSVDGKGEKEKGNVMLIFKFWIWFFRSPVIYLSEKIDIIISYNNAQDTLEGLQTQREDAMNTEAKDALNSTFDQEARMNEEEGTIWCIYNMKKCFYLKFFI